jgi:quinol monooxygenase YgiN
MLVIIGHFDLAPEDIDTATRLADSMTGKTAAEPGCLHYVFSIPVGHPNRLMLTECWQDAAALTAHLRQTHTETFLSEFRKLRIERRVVREYEAATVRDFDPRRYTT